MTPATTWLDSPCAAATAVTRAASLRDRVTAAVPVALYGAPLTGAAVALGAHQRAAYVVQGAAAAPAGLRRQTGGPAVYAGQGVFYLAVVLQHASALMDCPPGRILNRDVRGLLQGLRGLHVPGHYFGRDFVSVASRPGAFIAWDEREDGGVLFEAWIAVERSYVPDAAWIGYPPRTVDAFRGKQPITLREAGVQDVSAQRLFDAIVKGYATAYGLEPAPLAADVLAATLRDVDAATIPADRAADEPPLVWSAPYEESIGFVYAGVRIEGERLAEVRVGGDYFQNQLGQRALEQALTGCPCDGTEIGRAINAVYADRAHVIEGVAQMDSLRAVVLSATERAQQGLR